uniref:Copper transport protein n=1 Tax=Globisporangium ultimum (strain ATCC 200006 / CBS 805.95 / DAOM BR144) TaxID=431595 RepID=K3WW86_GLOUD
MATRRPTSSSSYLRTFTVVLLCAFCCALWSSAGGLVAAEMHMMDMPSDPVSGEMVMSEAYHFDLKNGQRLRFAEQNTLTQFLHDPKTGLKAAESVDAPAGNGNDDESSVLCPVCGMETSAHGGPQVSMQHGEQIVKTCSLTHAHQVYDQILLFQDVSSTAAPSDAADFCTGPGTTMLNGFSFGRNGTPCVLLWFPGWVLSTRWLYALGCVFVALVAVFNEYLLHVRRLLRKESTTLKRLRSVPNGSNSASLSTSEATQLLRSSSYHSAASQSCCPPWFRTLAPETQHLIHCFLHGFTILIAYLLMLVSMTYDWTLFLSVIGGYVVGHYVFGERRESMAELDQVNFP